MIGTKGGEVARIGERRSDGFQISPREMTKVKIMGEYHGVHTTQLGSLGEGEKVENSWFNAGMHDEFLVISKTN